MIKAAVSKLEQKDWDDFYLSEKARFVYVTNVVAATRISDKVLRDMDLAEADAYNRMAYDEMQESAIAKQLSSYGDSSLTQDAGLEGNKVNPALVRMYGMVTKAKERKEKPAESQATKYRLMCEDYYRISGHNLDPKVERSRKTYDLRMHDMRWAQSLRESNMGYTFFHSGQSDRLRACEGIQNGNDETSRMPKLEEREHPSQRRSVANRPSPTSQKPSFAYPFSGPRVYSDLRPKANRIPASIVQKHMANAPTSSRSVSEPNDEVDAYYDEGVDKDEVQNVVDSVRKADIDDGYFEEDDE
jgi:hypothetical protein